MSSFKDLTGQRFGRLVAVERVGSRNTFALWKCKCDCGNEAEVVSTYLINGDTKSCGCLKAQNIKIANTKHGMRKTRIYHIWKNMRQRCINKNNQAYLDYGGRGISVCEEWKEFVPFYNWAMGSGYKDCLTIDRIDNGKGYSPENCRWATMKEQSNNRRDNVFYEYAGQTKTISQWSDVCGISIGCLRDRIRHGWVIDRILGTPKNMKGT